MTGGAESASAAKALVLDPRRRGARVRLRVSEMAAGLALCLVVFLPQLPLGAARRDLALWLTCLQGLLLALVILSAAWARKDLSRPDSLARPATLFAITLLVGLWSLTPFVPGGPHPIWEFVDGFGAAALDRTGVLVEILRLLGLASVFLTAWLIGSDDERATFFLHTVVLAVLAASVAAFLFHIDAREPAASVAATGRRLTAPFVSSNTAGAFFGVCFSLAACAVLERLRAVTGGSAGRRLQAGAMAVVAAVAGLFALACLILTASRGALAATAASVLILIVWEGLARRWRLMSWAGLGVLACVGGLFLLSALTGSTLVERLSQGSAQLGGREPLLLAHWHAFLASPWMGFGLGSFDAINGLITTSDNFPNLWKTRATHNVYLQWLEEAGLLGALPMFLCVGLVLRSMALASARRRGMTTWIRGLFAACLVLLIHGLSDFGLQIPSIAGLFACLLGLGAGLAARARARP